MREGKDLKAYGRGLLNSFGEIAHAVESPEVQRYPIQLEWGTPAQDLAEFDIEPFLD